MEIVKTRLCKDEIEYCQICRVYVQSDEPRAAQRSSRRAHIGRYKLISTAPSTESISFARRLKLLRKKKKQQGDNQQLGKDRELKTEDQSSPQAVESPQETESSQSSDKDSTEKENTETVQIESSADIKVSTDHKEVKSRVKTVEKKPEFKSPTVKTAQTEKSVKKGQTKKNMSRPQFQSSFEEYIKPRISKAAAKVKKTQSSDSNSDLELNRKGTVVSYRPIKNMKNGNTITPPQEFETYYWLELPKPKIPESKKLGYQFENLVTEVKHMKLPSSEWKIKIMVHKQEMVSVSFSNKQTPEKVVSVNAKNSVCDISIDGKKLCLVGSPVYIHTIKDLEVLLDIMNDVDPDSPLIQYL